MRILIVKLSSIGDVVHTLPALDALRQGLGRAEGGLEIDWLVEEAASGVLENHPQIDNLIVVKNRGWLKDLGENLKAARFLKSRRYDMVLDFQGLFKSGIWVWLSGGLRKIGFSNAREGSHVFYNEKLPPFDPERHAVDRYLDLARHACGKPGLNALPRFVLNTTEADRERASRKLREAGLSEGGFFVIAARARWRTKMWDDEKFAEVARRVHKETGQRAVLVGSPSDRQGLEALRELAGEGAVNMAGRTGLRELFCLMGMASFVLTVDSGPMHMAVAAGARVVSLFGPTAPWRTGPYGAGQTVVRKGLQCSPCFKRDCADVRCMSDITADDVIDALRGCLELRGAARP